jgi:AraC family transcriptional regulator
VTALPDHEEELFWALRGGGGNFGVVIDMHIQLHQLESVRSGMLVYPFTEARTVLEGCAAIAASAPDELSIQLGFVAGADGEAVILIVPTWCGCANEGEDRIVPFLRLGTLLSGTAQTMSYKASLAAFDPYIVNGQKTFMETCWLPYLDRSMAQKDGSAPTTLLAGSAPGESGVVIQCVRFSSALHLSGNPRQHLVCFQLGQARFDCRIGGRMLQHKPQAGSLAICPAGCDCAADADDSIDAIIISIDPYRLALAAAEDSALEAQVTERLSGHDHALLSLARTMVCEGAGTYPSGPFFWNELAASFINALVARHTSRPEVTTRGMLGEHVLARLRGYVLDHLREPIEVAAVTPHRYIVHLRLQRAVELARGGRFGLAEIAMRTGFADQSHLWRWVRRVHGVTLTQLADTQKAMRPADFAAGPELWSV